MWLHRPLSDFNFPDRCGNEYHDLVEIRHRRRYHDRLRRREHEKRRRHAEHCLTGLLACFPLLCNPLS
ncbi:hypothetical protein PHMEG_00022043 [Phytophthora megakarya]|uniref:Uncharacterized protein n=1 Tax=Phytophthora megakarya TaxID=4795 RepID=A0A225VM07_9STRA|nr:hypothetical protein PHMEG_00022043 [Phytophthora megakarya]